LGWTFDVRSAIAFGTLASLLTAGVLWLSWRSLPRAMRPSLRWWLLALLMHTVGFALVALRGHVPDWLSLVLANGLLAGALSGMAIAMRRFYGRRERLGLHALLVLAVLLASAWFGLWHPQERWRIVLVALLCALPIAGSAWVALHRAHGSQVARLTGAGFAFVAVVVALRAGVELLGPAAPALDLQPTLPVLACVSALLLLPLLATAGFLLMCTERSQAELERSARIDYLTGIHNRRAIEELAASAISAARRHAAPLGLLLVDVDHFKQFNDRHGHEAGDQALVVTVQRIRAVMRQEDMVGRVGGEEFVVLMPGADLDSARAAAERLCHSFVADGVAISGDSGGGQTLAASTVVTVSVGVAALRGGDAGYAELLGRADRAMYAAKAGGRNRVVADLAAG
jgi:diguanylate cyclase (GGDEF)-like protein